MLTSKGERILAELEAGQDNYLPNPGVSSEIASRSITCIVGPSAIGKSTIMRAIVESDPAFAVAGTLTTREPRSDDNDNGKQYDYIPYTDEGLEGLTRRIEGGELVQYHVHDSTRHVYGTDVSHFPTRHSLLDATASSVTNMRRLPFGECITIGLVAPAEQWGEWLNLRFPVGHKSRHARIIEAITSFTWMLSQPREQVAVVENQVGHQTEVAALIIAICKGQTSAATANARDLAAEGLRYARKLL